MTLLIAAASLLALLMVAVSIGLANARAEPIARQLAIEMPNWAPDAPPLRVALLADIHLGNRAMDGARLTRIVDDVNAARPDLVLIAGDFVAGHDATGASGQAPALTAPLARLRAPLGVIAVLGNHDYWTAPQEVRSALTSAGIVVLENQAVRRGPLAVVGVGDRFSGHDNLSQAAAAASTLGGVPLVLTHSPDLIPELPADFTLVLAAHTHCGEIVLPWYGPLITRSPREHWRRLYNPRYLCGIVRDSRRLTIVTAGLGSGTIPIRLGAMPDWWLLTLHPLRLST